MLPARQLCARVPHRAVLAVTGRDAAHFLNGIVSSTVHAPSPGPFYTAFLHAQGRVMYDVFVYPQSTDGDAFLIDYDARTSEAPPLTSLLKRFVLRSKVKIADVREEWDVWAAWGDRSDSAARKWRWGRSGVEPIWADGPWTWGTPGTSLVDQRVPGMGKRVLVRRDDLPSAASSHDVVSSDDYTLHRIMNGVPEGLDDIVPMQAFPMESNLDMMGAVEFRKGCYVGQELTVRTYHTGFVRKRILPVQLHRIDTPPAGPSADGPILTPGLDVRLSAAPALVEPAVTRPRPRATGKLLTSLHGVGLALLRLEHLEAVERGELALQVGDNVGLKPWWPEWWPRKGVDEDPESEH